MNSRNPARSSQSPAIAFRSWSYVCSPRTVCAALIAVLIAGGCSRDHYRRWADSDAYHLIRSRQYDDRWEIPIRSAEPDPTSRLADIHDPDCGPLPPDDPAAACYMTRPYNSKKEVAYWQRRGEGYAIDSEHWLPHLPRSVTGALSLPKRMKK